MLHKQTQVYRDLNLATDIIGLELILLLAHFLRFHVNLIQFKNPPVPLANYVWLFIFLPFIWIFAGLESGLYQMVVPRGRWLFRVVRSMVVAMLIIITTSFLMKRFEYSRIVFTYFALLGTVFLILNRMAWSYGMTLISQSRYAKRAILVDCGSGMGAALARKMKQSAEYGINLLGWVPTPDMDAAGQFPELPRLGNYQDLDRVVKENSVQSVFVVSSLASSAALGRIFKDLANTLVDVAFVPDFQNLFLFGQEVERINEFPFFHLQATRLVGWNLVLKRAFDLIGGIALLIFFSPLLLTIAIAIKLNSKGPVFFLQPRYGGNETPFKMFKFRTMMQDAEAKTGQVRAEKDDPRVTRIGRLLRKTSLDELPNLLNVIKGEMSLVGPRPEPTRLFEKVKESNSLFCFRHKFKPGMTGWAQVNGLRGGHYVEKSLNTISSTSRTGRSCWISKS